jgi:hypothetical protein
MQRLRSGYVMGTKLLRRPAAMPLKACWAARTDARPRLVRTRTRMRPSQLGMHTHTHIHTCGPRSLAVLKVW